MVAVGKMPAEQKKLCHWGGAEWSPRTGLWYLHDHAESLKTHVEDGSADTIDMGTLMWARAASCGIKGERRVCSHADDKGAKRLSHVFVA